MISVDAEVEDDTGISKRHRGEWLRLNEAPPANPPAKRAASLNVLKTWIDTALAASGVDTIPQYDARLVPGGC